MKLDATEAGGLGALVWSLVQVARSARELAVDGASHGHTWFLLDLLILTLAGASAGYVVVLVKEHRANRNPGY